MNIEKNIDTIFSKIEQARICVSEHNIIKVIAVSKYVDAGMINNVYSLGQRAFGENKIQDFKAKSQELDSLALQWHFLGGVQSNKINALIDLNPYLLHSLHSLDFAYELDKRLKVKNKTLNALLQINSANEQQKLGFTCEEAIESYINISENFKNINLKGVMSMGAHSEEPKEVSKSFENTYKIFEKLKQYNASICSMGMSGDYELAIKNGSNMVRIGKAFFEKNS